MRDTNREQLRQSLREITDAYATTVTQYEKTISILETELARSEPREQHAARVTKEMKAEPFLDRQLFTIVYLGRRCFLGNTLSFSLMDRLLQDRNKYVSVEELLTDVWNAHRSRTAVRSAIKMLRRQLRQSRMNDLAQAIVGRVAGHYAIFVPQTL